MKLGFIGTGKIASSVITGICAIQKYHSLKYWFHQEINQLLRKLTKKFKKVSYS